MASRDSDRPPPDKSRRKATPTRRRDEDTGPSGRRSARHSPPRRPSSGRSTQEGSSLHHSAPARRSDNNSSSRRRDGDADTSGRRSARHSPPRRPSSGRSTHEGTYRRHSVQPRHSDHNDSSRRTPSQRSDLHDSSRRQSSRLSPQSRASRTPYVPRQAAVQSTSSNATRTDRSRDTTRRTSSLPDRDQYTNATEETDITTALASTQIASTSSVPVDTASIDVHTPPHARADLLDYPLDLDFVAAGQEAYEEEQERLRNEDIVYHETLAFWLGTPPKLHDDRNFALDPSTDAFSYIPLGMSPRIIIPYEKLPWRQGGSATQNEFQACVDIKRLEVEFVLTRGCHTQPLHPPLKLAWLINIKPALDDNILFMSDPYHRQVVQAFIYAARQLITDPNDTTRGMLGSFFRNFATMEVIAAVLFANRGQILYQILSSSIDDRQADVMIDRLWELFEDLATKDPAYYNILIMALDVHTDISKELPAHPTADGDAWLRTLQNGKTRLRDTRMRHNATIQQYMSNLHKQLAQDGQRQFQQLSTHREGERQTTRHRMPPPSSDAFTLPGYDNAHCEHGVISPPTLLVEPFEKYPVVKSASLMRVSSERQKVNFFKELPRHTHVIRGSKVVIATLTARQKEVLEAIHLARPCAFKIPDEFTHIWIRDPDFVLPPIDKEKHALSYDEYVHDPGLVKFCQEAAEDPENVDLSSTLHPWNPETRRSKRPSQSLRQSPKWGIETRFHQMSQTELTEVDKRLWHGLLHPENKVNHSFERYRDDPMIAYKAEDAFQHVLWLLATKTIPSLRVTGRPTHPPPDHDNKQVYLEYEPIRKYNRHFRFSDGILPEMVPYLGGRSVGLPSVQDMERTYFQLISDIPLRWDLLWLLFYRNINGNTDHIIQRAVRIFLGDKSTFKDPCRTPEQALEDFLRQPYYSKRDIETSKGDTNPKCSCLGDSSYFHCPEVCYVLSDFSTFLGIAKATGICPGTSDNTGQICARSRVWEFGSNQPTPHLVDYCSLLKKHGRCEYCRDPDHQMPWCRLLRVQLGTYDMDEDDMVPPLHILVNWNRSLFPRHDPQMFSKAVTSGDSVQLGIDTFFQGPEPNPTPAAEVAPSNIHALAFDLAVNFATSSSTGRKRPSQESLQIEHKRQKDDRPSTASATPSKEKAPRPILKERDHPKDSRRQDDKKQSAARSRHRSTDRK